MTITATDKFWAGLKTSTRNSLQRHCPDVTQPWLMSVKELIRIPGIGPAAVAEIAKLTEKHCV